MGSDDDDLERLAGKTRTETAELRRQRIDRRSRGWLERLATLPSTGWIVVAIGAVAVLVGVVLRWLR